MEHGFFAGVNHYIEHYGYLAVALGILLEDFGLPTPGEMLLITGAISASTGALNVYLLLLLAWVGAVIGDNIGYAIGHFGGHHLMVRYGGRIGITRDRLKQVEAFFEHYGGWVIVFARFVVILRQFNGIVAGNSRHALAALSRAERRRRGAVGRLLGHPRLLAGQGRAWSTCTSCTRSRR